MPAHPAIIPVAAALVALGGLAWWRWGAAVALDLLAAWCG